MRKQQLLKFAVQRFYGVRSSTLAEAKKIGLAVLQESVAGPKLRMEYSKAVTRNAIEWLPQLTSEVESAEFPNSPVSPPLYSSQ